MDNSYIVKLAQLDYAYIIPGRCLWKLEITKVDTAIPVISTCFWVMCQAAIRIHASGILKEWAAPASNIKLILTGERTPKRGYDCNIQIL